MSPARRLTVHRALASICGASFAIAILCSGSAHAHGGAPLSAAGTPPSSGGTGIGGVAPTAAHPPRAPAPPSKHDRGKWLSGITITEYWPAPESWFVGRLVERARPDRQAPDRLAVLGDGRLDGGSGTRARRADVPHRFARRRRLGDASAGRPTSPSDGWASGRAVLAGRRLLADPQRRGHVPACSRAAGRQAAGAATFRCAASRSRPAVRSRLRFYQSIAVDPSRDPAREPGLHPGLQGRRARRLVRRTGHRRGDQRPPRRRLSHAAGEPDGRRAVPDRGSAST